MRDLLTIWQAFNIDAIASTWPVIQSALVALIQARHALSAGLAASYYTDFRDAEQVAGSVVPVLAAPPATTDVIGALLLAGPRTAGNLVALARPDAAAVTFSNVSGEVTRQTLNGGRDTLVESVNADPKALGYARVTDSSPCAFCAMLASRGPVYRSKGSAAGSQYHRHCGCTAEPVFSHHQPWPGQGREYADLWKQAKQESRKKDGADPAIEFRRLIEGR